ncbi:MAG: EamA family transporter RarD [Chloroflexi bacterium]|nr:EamA family transporter RarD [Chloroflexota bacterium]
MNRGIWYAIGAYSIWGLFPAYWKWLGYVPAPQLMSHRLVWSCVILIAYIFLTRQWRAFRRSASNRRVLGVYLVAAVILGVNWLIYLWAIASGFVVESSLGYFINPLVNVLLGVILLRERLRAWQWLPVALATLGVVYLTVMYGSPPWIALSLALTFGFYGLVKKTAPLNSLHGLALETSLLFVPALLWLTYADVSGQGAFLHTGAIADSLMIGAGLVTTIPLLLFASAARRIPLSMMGILQYIAPTLQFLLGVLMFGEPFTQTQFIGFGMVWVSLIIFAVEGFLTHRTQSTAVVAVAE